MFFFSVQRWDYKPDCEGTPPGKLHPPSPLGQAGAEEEKCQPASTDRGGEGQMEQERRGRKNMSTFEKGLLAAVRSLTPHSQLRMEIIIYIPSLLPSMLLEFVWDLPTNSTNICLWKAYLANPSSYGLHTCWLLIAWGSAVSNLVWFGHWMLITFE